MNQQKSKKNQYKKWLGLINIPVQMGVIVYLSSLFGKWLDGKYPNSNDVYTKGLTLGGVAIAFYFVIKQVNKLNKEEK
jgi:hypothetical protein